MKPWPCRHDGCECPGFVVARDLKEDIRHMAFGRMRAAICELYPDHATPQEIIDHASRVMGEVDAAD